MRGECNLLSESPIVVGAKPMDVVIQKSFATGDKWGCPVVQDAQGFQTGSQMLVDFLGGKASPPFEPDRRVLTGVE